VSGSSREDPRLRRLAGICANLPETTREDSGRHVTFRIRKRTFAYFLDDHRGNEGIVGLACKAPGGWSEALIEAQPERFYKPAYLHHRGWIGVRLDTDDVDWEEVAEFVTESYVLTAPKRLAARVEGRPAAR
jgi:hypothetical protein